MIIPRIKIAHLPTPVEWLPNITGLLNGPNILIKRDDLTGIGFGGNKIRKLECLLADAQANGAQMLITTGALQSNHCRQTAAVAAKYGLKCRLVLAGEEPQQPSGNYLLDLLMGAEVIWTSRAKRDATLKSTFDQAWEEGERPFMIPYGGSNPVGAMGYVVAMQELAAQQVNPDWIVFPSSSGGTQAGMALGARLTGFKGKILGISIEDKAADLQSKVADLANQMAERLMVNEVFSSENILVNDDYLGAGYGMFGELEKNAIKFFAQKAALFLDPVYTGRAAGALMDLINKKFLKRGETVLFWHTGGLPAIFAESYQPELM